MNYTASNTPKLNVSEKLNNKSKDTTVKIFTKGNNEFINTKSEKKVGLTQLFPRIK